MSYTSFSYSNLKLNNKVFNQKIIATIDVKNTGSVAGKKVVQLSITAPSKELKKLSEELKGFAKTRSLNETETIRFTIDPKGLSSFNTKSASWIEKKELIQLKLALLPLI